MNAETLAKLNDKSIQEMLDNLKREIATHRAILSKLEKQEVVLYMEQRDRALGFGTHKKEESTSEQ